MLFRSPEVTETPATPDASEQEAPAPSPAVSEETKDATPEPAAPEADTAKPRTGRRARSKVPSWDEIVFGAKPE